MRKYVYYLLICSAVILSMGCAGMKVIHPGEENNAGTLALDVSEGQVKLVPTYTCKLESMGNRFSSVGKSEESARKDVVEKCRSRTLLSFCESEKVKCEKN